MTSTRTSTAQLGSTGEERKRHLGVLSVTFMIIAASAPLTVIAGGVTTTLSITGNLGVPLSFLVCGIVLAIFAAGYAAMSRNIVNAGAFYSYVAQGLGRPLGVGASLTALVSYNAMQIGMYGLLGYSVSSQLAAWFGLDVPWWIIALVGVAVVGILGVNRVDLSAKLLGVLVALEFIVVIIFDITSFAVAPEGVSAAPLTPSALFVPGVGIVLAGAIAAFMGFESGALYGEESRDPKRTVARATYLAVGVIAVFYAISSWAMIVGVGPTNAVAAAAKSGPDLVFGILGQHVGQVVADLAHVLFITSVLAALISFHNAVARYLFSLGREGVLPSSVAARGRRSGAPVAGSLIQTLIACVVLIGFIIASLSWTPPNGLPSTLFPVLTLFAWLTTTGAFGLTVLMVLVSIAVVGFFRSRTPQPSLWHRLIAPVVAAVALAALVVLIMANFNTLLTSDPTAPPTAATFILPAIVVIAGVVGIVWGFVLRRRKPEIYAQIGHGTDESATVHPEHL